MSQQFHLPPAPEVYLPHPGENGAVSTRFTGFTALAGLHAGNMNAARGPEVEARNNEIQANEALLEGFVNCLPSPHPNSPTAGGPEVLKQLERNVIYIGNPATSVIKSRSPYYVFGQRPVEGSHDQKAADALVDVLFLRAFKLKGERPMVQVRFRMDELTAAMNSFEGKGITDPSSHAAQKIFNGGFHRVLVGSDSNGPVLGTPVLHTHTDLEAGFQVPKYLRDKNLAKRVFEDGLHATISGVPKLTNGYMKDFEVLDQMQELGKAFGQPTALTNLLRKSPNRSLVPLSQW